MERFTVKTEEGCRLAQEGRLEEAICRLARYEDAHGQLSAQQEQIEEELEKLRSQGKQKSGRFRELVARKLMNRGILDLFEA